LKPGNIVLSNGSTKLLDFGIAKHVPVNSAEETLMTLADATLPGVFLGTPKVCVPRTVPGPARGRALINCNVEALTVFVAGGGPGTPEDPLRGLLRQMLFPSQS